MQTSLISAYYEDGLKLVHSDLDNIKKNYLQLGYHLKQIYEFGWYKFRYEADNFDLYCRNEFNLSKSTVNRLINIVNRFCCEDSFELLDKYKNFSQSQLYEMLSMSDDDIDYVSPQMTVKEIRQLKSYDISIETVKEQLVIKDVNCNISEDVLVEPVELNENIATSQQKNLFSYDLIMDIIRQAKMTCLNNDDMQDEFASGYLNAISYLKSCFQREYNSELNRLV